MLQSSFAPARRQHAAGAPLLVRLLPALRAELERQRDFRTEQLTHLIAHDENRVALVGYAPRARGEKADRALQEVRSLVAAGARQALADIELALARMDDGTYGRCRHCHANISVAVLTAIPATTLCQACQRAAAASVP